MGKMTISKKNGKRAVSLLCRHNQNRGKNRVIVVSSGSPFRIIKKLVNEFPNFRIAMIDKDPLGGICLTRGCVPTKLMLYSAELISLFNESSSLCVDAEIKNIRFRDIMHRTRSYIQNRVSDKRSFINNHDNIDYYAGIAQFIEPYTLKIGNDLLKGENIILCLGSEPFIPPIEGIKTVDYYTNKNILKMDHLPSSMVFIGGGFISIEFGFFFSRMGVEVTIIEGKDRILGPVEPEISNVIYQELSDHLEIHTSSQVISIR